MVLLALKFVGKYYGVRPKKLLLLGHGENSIYLIHQELRSIVTEGTLVPIIADIRDKNQFRPNLYRL